MGAGFIYGAATRSQRAEEIFQSEHPQGTSGDYFGAFRIFPVPYLNTDYVAF